MFQKSMIYLILRYWPMLEIFGRKTFEVDYFNEMMNVGL